MRIGILTLPLHTNYGGILQAWALQTVLEGMGHQVEVFGLKKPGRNPLLMPLVWAKRVLLHVAGKTSVAVFHEIIEARHQRRKSANFDKFIRNNIHLRNIAGLDSIPHKRYDAIVVGSDQIWRREYIGYLWKCADASQAFLSAVTDSGTLKVAYAASLGVDNWLFTPEETTEITNALHSFSAVSVRELSGVGLLKEYTGKDAVHVLDPTMLLPKERYISLINSHLTIGGVISYILDPDLVKSRIVCKVAELSGKGHTELNRSDADSAAISIEEWIAGMAYADIVVTDSFHGCVFALIFGKPLVFIKNPERGNARFDSMIETFGLSGNLVESPEDITDLSKFATRMHVTEQLAAYRERSLEFLSASL